MGEGWHNNTMPFRHRHGTACDGGNRHQLRIIRTLALLVRLGREAADTSGTGEEIQAYLSNPEKPLRHRKRY